MLFVRVFFLVFYIGHTKLLKHGKQNKNLQIMTSAPMRYFLPENNYRGGYDTRTSQKILNLDDSGENYSGEFFSLEVGSRNEDFGYRRTETKLERKRMFHSSPTSTGSTSTSFDTHEFKEEWAKRWEELKIDAFHPNNAKLRPSKHVVNMVAARPWNKPCGDPTQHDVPWGTCTLNFECDGEYRIYRGDFVCGKTQLVCCAVEGYRNDLNAPFDVSFADTSIFSTSSEEEVRKARGSKENRRRKRVRKRKKIEGIRHRRKRSIKKLIRKVIHQIRKELNRAFRNNTRKRRLALVNMKILIKAMKKKYLKGRHKALEIHDAEWMNITSEFIHKLDKIRLVNQHFLTNDTFREIIEKGSMKKTLGRKLLAAYPELAEFPEMKALQNAPEAQLNKTRRLASGRKEFKKTDVFLQYYIK